MTTTVNIQHKGSSKLLLVQQFQSGSTEMADQVGPAIAMDPGSEMTVYAHSDNCFILTEVEDVAKGHIMQRERTIGLSFGDVLEGLWQGRHYKRKNWNAPNQHIALQVTDEHSKMRHNYIYINPVDGKLVPWAPSQTDVLASDWEVA